MESSLREKLDQYKRKYYTNLLIKGSLITLTVLLSVFLFFAFLEHFVRLNSTLRAILFFSYLLIAGFIVYKWLIQNVLGLFFEKRRISDEIAASSIGGYFPDVRDKLLNIIQLYRQPSQPGSLLSAGVTQKSQQVHHIEFQEAVNFQDGLRYIKYLLVPFVVVAIAGFVAPGMLTESPVRIINYQKQFVPAAPFTFILENDELLAFKNEDFRIDLKMEGSALPDNVYVTTAGRKLKLHKAGNNNFQYVFEKVQNDISFQFEAAGFKSIQHKVKVVSRPNIRNFDVQIEYPKYINRNPERMSNVGNFNVPEGSKIKWLFSTIETEEMTLQFSNEDEKQMLSKTGKQLFETEQQLFKSADYTIELKNAYSGNKDNIRYQIEVITDQYPQISLDQYQDTTLYNMLVLGGKVSDDYGLSELKLFYNIIRDSKPEDENFESIELPIRKGETTQSFYKQWDLADFGLKSGDNVTYYMQVRDNDGINGRKATKTPLYTFKVPSRDELENILSESSKNTENQIDKSVEKAKELSKNLQELEERLKGKKEISWQDQKMMEELLKQKRELEQELERMREQFEENVQKRDRFQDKENKQLQDKVAQLQQLMDELLDEETKKLYEELQKLLEENANPDQMRDMIDKLNNKENNLEKELERTLELFKRMKYEQKLEDITQKTNELQKEQEKLSEETKDKVVDNEELKDKQEELNKELDNTEKQLEELNKLNQDLKSPNATPDLSEDIDNIRQEQNGAMDDLDKGKEKPASQKQQKAADELKKMAEKLQQMQMSMEMEMMQENLGDLRQILDNLVKLSFEQEDLMVDFKNINLSDPRIIKLSQDQLRIKDNAKLVEDSLRSLAERVFQIRSFVTREVNEMNKHMDDAMDAIKERKKGIASGKQQYVMTSMNNLALMLDDVLTQMQQAMADAMGKPQKGKDGEMDMPSMSELQKQLGERISEIKKSGMQGRQLSEEMAKMAAEQERLRRMMQQLEKELNESKEGGGAGGMEDVIKKMEENEIDMVNKKITQETINRQKEIETRLLEAENALREREQSEEREGEHAKEYEQRIPEAFDEYIKQKAQEIELLRTVPPKLNPYYKEQVNEYFKRIGSL